MGGFSKKKQKTSSAKKKTSKLDAKHIEPNETFTLSDVSTQELEKRRIPVYSYLL
jgi:hypothetical protein